MKIPIWRKARTFYHLPLRLKLIFFEAFFTSAWVRLSLSFFPFRRVLGWLGSSGSETPLTEEPESLEVRLQVARALRLCNRYAPWPTECYTLALTGKLLLRRRGVASTLYIGFKKSTSSNYEGHAWLRAADRYISGYPESQAFTVNYFFS